MFKVVNTDLRAALMPVLGLSDDSLVSEASLCALLFDLDLDRERLRHFFGGSAVSSCVTPWA